MKYFENNNAAIYYGLSLDVLRGLPDNSIDAVVTDPPYGFAFMGKKWDYELPSVETWAEVLRVLKPGGHLLAFGGPRTYHRAVCRIEDAGFEIRDCLMWIFGSGFPKSLDVSKAIDKAAGAERETIGSKTAGASSLERKRRVELGYRSIETNCNPASIPITAPATEAAQQWEGWGTALKPAFEPIVLARKPLDGTVAANVQAWGVGALNIDGCRVESGNEGKHRTDEPSQFRRYDGNGGTNFAALPGPRGGDPSGRWPANVLHDGSEEVVGMFPEAPGQQRAVGPNHGAKPTINAYGNFGPRDHFAPRDDSGSAARFFYCAKATAEERNEWLDHLPERVKVYNGQAAESSEDMKPVEKRFTTKARNTHPTVKPLALMRYLCRLICPPNGLILDPFFGSGSTGVAAIQEGFRIIGIEREQEYCEIAKGRVSHAVRVIEKNPALPYTVITQNQQSLF